MIGQRLIARGRGARDGLRLSWVDDDTIKVEAGACIFRNGAIFELAADTNVSFTALDTGSRTLGRDYAVFATPDGIKLTLITTSHAGDGLLPSGYTLQNVRLLGYFHNGPKADGTVGAERNQAIFQYSVVSNDLLNMSRPYRAHPDLPAGVPLPGMVRAGGFAIGIYQTSREDATASAAGSSVYPTSRYGVVPWVSIQGFEANVVALAAGCRLPTLHEWWMAAMWRPGYATVALQNGNSYYGSSSDDTYLTAPGAPTAALAGAGAGNLGAGAYKYKVTFVNANGETQGGTESAGVTVNDPGVDGQISLTAIPTGGAGTTARKIYRTTAGGSTHKLVATINDNVTTVYTDNIADASLGATVPGVNSTGAQQGENDPTHNAGRCLVGTGPRTIEFASASGRSWFSPLGCADLAGNVWEWAAYLAAGLYSAAGYGAFKNWNFGDGDGVWNVDSYAYHPQQGGWYQGLPAMALLGGYWTDGSFAGVRSVNLGNSPGYSLAGVGFRLCR